MFVVTSLHHGCPSYRLSIPSKFLAPVADDDGPQGGNSKMTSPSNTGGRNRTVSCFMVLRSIVDNSFRDRCILRSKRRQSMMLSLGSTRASVGGTESEE